MSPNAKNLSLASETETILRGAEGILAEAREIVISAKNDIDIITVSKDFHVILLYFLKYREP